MEPRLTLIKARKDYQAGIPTMSDAEYDKLEKEFSRENPNDPVLSQIGGKAGKVAHEVHMLSLKKVYIVVQIENLDFQTAKIFS